MRRIETQTELSQLHARGLGFIYNDYAGTGASASRYNVLHRASCPWILRSRASIPKYYAANLRQAEDWLEAHRGKEGVGWKRCGSCRTRSAQPSTPDSHTVQEKRGALHRPGPLPQPQSQTSDPYLVHTKETKSGKVVEAWSAQRLPYEPRGWLLAFRNELRAALARLCCEPGELLVAVYASAHEAFFDVENVLFYNVGPAFLKGAGRYGVRYERGYQMPPPPQPLPWSAGHYHRYNLGAATGGFENWGRGAVIARWHAETHDRGDLFDCTRLWFLLKTRGHLTVFQQAEGQPFILRLLITATPKDAPAATDVLKPVSDGIVSAFHCHNGQNEAELCSRLATRTTAGPDLLRTFLGDRSTAVLGTRRLLWPFRTGVQWNPADDLCVAAELRVLPVAGQDYYTMQGELLAAKSTGATR